MWDPAVHSYAIHDLATGKHLGSFYADWYPRENKRGGAWMDALLTGNSAETRPPSSWLNLRQSDSTGGREACVVDPSRSRAIFHEFGHCYITC